MIASSSASAARRRSGSSSALAERLQATNAFDVALVVLDALGLEGCDETSVTEAEAELRFTQCEAVTVARRARRFFLP